MFKLLQAKDGHTWRFIRFGIVGLGSGGVYAFITWLCITDYHFYPETASAVGYMVSIPMNFIGQRKFAFNSEGSIGREFLKFVIVHFLNAILSVLVMRLCVHYLNLNFMWGILLVILAIPLCTYCWLLLFVFTARKL